MKKYAKRRRVGKIKRARKIRRARGVKSIVNRAINRAIETKFVTSILSPTTCNAVIQSNDFVSCLPPITLGAGQNSRIGHSVRPIKMVIQGHVVYNAGSLFNVTENGLLAARLLGIRLFVVEDKTNKSYNNGAVYNTNILNPGGYSTEFSGATNNFYLPANTDQFKIYADRKMRMLKPYGVTSTNTAANAMSEVHSSMFHPFRIVLGRKKLPAVLKFDSTDGVQYPTHFNPYVAVGYTDLLNNAADGVTTQIQITWRSTLYFKDG